MFKLVLEESEITDLAILAKVQRYKAIVHSAANDDREFTPAEVRTGTRLLKELIDDGVMAWWDQGWDNFVTDVGGIVGTKKA